MRVVIIGSGQINDYEYLKKQIHKDDYIICADGGYNHAKNMGIVPQLLVGDFDSIRDKLNDFIVGHRDIDNYLDVLEAFFDEFDSRQYEIEALTPKDSQRPEELPFELADGEQKYFTRAIEAGYIDGRKWVNEKQVQLGYFCFKVFSNPRPITALEEFFGVKNLAASITQAGYAPKRDDVKRWRDAMDKAIFYD